MPHFNDLKSIDDVQAFMDRVLLPAIATRREEGLAEYYENAKRGPASLKPVDPADETRNVHLWKLIQNNVTKDISAKRWCLLDSKSVVITIMMPTKSMAKVSLTRSKKTYSVFNEKLMFELDQAANKIHAYVVKADAADSGDASLIVRERILVPDWSHTPAEDPRIGPVLMNGPERCLRACLLVDGMYHPEPLERIVFTTLRQQSTDPEHYFALSESQKAPKAFEEGTPAYRNWKGTYPYLRAPSGRVGRIQPTGDKQDYKWPDFKWPAKADSAWLEDTRFRPIAVFLPDSSTSQSILSKLSVGKKLKSQPPQVSYSAYLGIKYFKAGKTPSQAKWLLAAPNTSANSVKDDPHGRILLKMEVCGSMVVQTIREEVLAGLIDAPPVSVNHFYVVIPGENELAAARAEAQANDAGVSIANQPDVINVIDDDEYEEDRLAGTEEVEVEAAVEVAESAEGAAHNP